MCFVWQHCFHFNRTIFRYFFGSKYQHVCVCIFNNTRMSENKVDMMEEDDNENENSSDESMEEEESNNIAETPKEVYLPGGRLEEGEELVCDQSAYRMLHQAQTGSPCLSFDIIKDNLGDNRETYPLTAYIVAGTQAPQTHVNSIIVMRLSNLQPMKKSDEDDDDDGEDDSDEEDDKKPRMSGALIKHQGCVNRIRVCLPILTLI